jgi:uncharacterized OB-fold protein
MWAPNGPVCPRCFSSDFEWKELSGKGKIATWVIFHKLYHKAFAAELPYNVAFVELDEGPRIIANVLGVTNEDLSIGMRVKVIFEKINDEVTIPKFEPDTAG